MKVTRRLHAKSKQPNPGKVAALREQAQRLGQVRSKLRALAHQHRNPRKRQHIRQFNLGRKTLDRYTDKAHAHIRDIVFQLVHQVVDKAAVIAAEDLTAPMNRKCFGNNVPRHRAVHAVQEGESHLAGTD